MSEQTEQKIRHILEKYIGPSATSVNREDDFWQNFPDVSRFGSKKQQEFSKEISDVFHATLTEAEWEDAVSISALAEILSTGKLGADQKAKNLDLNIKASWRGIKNASIILLPIVVLLALINKKGSAIGFFVLYLAVLLFHYLIIRSFRKSTAQLQKQ